MSDGQDEVARLQAELERVQALHAASESENARLQRQLTEALEQQTATAEVLRVIASSQAELEPVFEALAERAYRLCHASSARLYVVDGDTHRIVMSVAESDEALGLVAGTPGRGIGMVGPLSRQSMTGRTILDRRVLHVEDAESEETVKEFPISPTGPGFPRSRVHVPLLRDGEAIGIIAVSRLEYAPFSDREIALLEAFADQAVIAIENARLFQELEQRTAQLTEALEQQTALSEVLRVIASSPTDLTPVLSAVAEAAGRLCGTNDVVIHRIDGEWIEVAATTGPFKTRGLGDRRRIARNTAAGRAIVDGRTVHIHDILAESDQEYGEAKSFQSVLGYRTLLATPLLRSGVPIGSILIGHSEVHPFTEKQITLLETFADQAVIAIENARLFRELQESNRQVTTALEQQTAFAEVLRVIASSPPDVQRVLDSIIETAMRLCGAAGAGLYRPRARDNHLAMCSAAGVSAERLIRVYGPDYFDQEPGLEISHDSLGGRAFLTGRTIVVSNGGETIRAEFTASVESLARNEVQSAVVTPLMQRGEAIGLLAVMHSEEGRPFSDEQVALLETFADQAVIAIENARLFQELEQRTAQLTETLKQQTAQAEVLQVIASSPTDLDRVLDALVRSVASLCSADVARVSRLDVDTVVTMASTSGIRGGGFAIAGTVMEQVLAERRTIHVFGTPEEQLARYPGSPGARFGSTQLSTPLMRQGQPIGVINMVRNEHRPFTNRQITLLETFAAQAVIAIENARLFEELEQRTAQLTRSVDELHVLGEVGQAVSSSLDLPTVLSAIVANATRLAGADGGIVYEYDDTAGVFELRAADQLSDELAATLQAARLRLGEGVVGRAALTRAPLQVEDVERSDVLTPVVRAAMLAEGRRSVLAVPLLREERVLGGLVLSRRTPGAFPDEVVALLQTLATQSALAIHNARLYQTLEAQGQALSEASQHKSQFLANMSHELRTPLNAVIGYSEMLHEELSDLGQEALVPDVEKITAAGRHLLGLINDILDLSKIEAGKMELFLESVDIAALLHDVAATVEPLIARNGNRLQLTVAADAGSIYADATKLRQILFNLLGNAAKFTENGTIELRVERDEWRVASGEGRVDGDSAPSPLAPRSSNLITFTVADNGIGMSEEQLDRLFQAFMQAEASTTRRFGGTGLGLTLVRHFAEMMEGDVQVTSAIGTGSTFVVRLPAVVTSLEQRAREREGAGPLAGQQSAAPSSAWPGGSDDPFVLIVDDDAASRELLRRYLEADGVRVVEANGGAEGLRLAHQLQPALITLDVLMPGLDGWAVLGALKDDPSTAEIPVILLTILDDRDLGYALGAADYLTKPIDRDRLLRAVCKHVRRPAGGEVRRALVVEDDLATREMLGRLLQREGWAVDEAANGRIGLERVAAGPPDLILLDLMMPELDGFGFVEQLRARPEWRTIPVLVITAKDLTAQERLRLNGWVEQVLQKGAYTRTELFSEVRALVRASVERPTSGAASTGATGSTTAGQQGSGDDGENPPG